MPVAPFLSSRYGIANPQSPASPGVARRSVRRIYGYPSSLPQVVIALYALMCGLPTSGTAQKGGMQDGIAARTKGRPDAPVVVYEMSDFQCPYCRDFALG